MSAFTVLDQHPGIGKVRRAMRTSPTPDQIAASRSTLWLGAAASVAGHRVELETGRPPADVSFQTAEGRVVVEAKAIMRAEVLRDVDSWLHHLYAHIRDLVSDRSLSIIGTAVEPLSDEHTTLLARNLDDAGRLVRLGLSAPTIRAGRNTFEVVPVGARGPGTHIALPPRDAWRKISERLGRIVEQATASGATWALIESLDDLWMLTPWSQQSLPERAAALAEHTRRRLHGHAALDGVAFSNGAATTDLTSQDESTTPEPGVTGHRRRLDAGRVRELVLVTLSERGAADMPAWQAVIDAEARVTAVALDAAGIVAPHELRLARSAPGRPDR